MAIRSQISAIVANQIGRLQGELEAKIQTESSKLVSKFANQCPSDDELVKVVKTRNNLLKTINNFQKTVNRFSKLNSKLRPPISAAKIIIRLLKTNPVPSAIIPPSGGVGVPLGRITTLSDRLRNANILLEALEDDVTSLDTLLSSIELSLNNVRQILDSVNSKVESCVQELQNQATSEAGGASDSSTSTTTSIIKDLLNQVQPLENTGSEGPPNESYLYRGANGKDYTLAIIEDTSEPGPIPRRVAVAKDKIGVIVLRGQPSFSSDTQVLLDELKFTIDNQLP